MVAFDTVMILLLVLPIVIVAIKQPEDEVQEETLPNGGSNKLYRNVLDLTGRPYITFALKSAENGHLLLSGLFGLFTGCSLTVTEEYAYLYHFIIYTSVSIKFLVGY